MNILTKLRQIIGSASNSQEEELLEAELLKALPDLQSKQVASPEAVMLQNSDIANVFMLDSNGSNAESTKGLDFDQLRAMSRIPLIAAIINTRMNQIAEFAQPSHAGDGIGFQIRLKDRSAAPTDEQLERIKLVTQLMLTCGDPRIDFESSFESFLRMLVRDSLTFDSACFEVIRARDGAVAGFNVVDASTIRRAKLTEVEQKVGRRDAEGVYYVQVVNNKVTAEFGAKDLCMGIRRPRSDARFRGYGEPELELCVGLLTNLLNAEIYNSANFTSGINVSGIVAVKTKMNPQLFRAFRREFYQMLSGSANSKKTPLIQLDPDADEDIKALNLSASNKEMEFENWVHHLMKEICAIWAIDPVEVGFSFGDTGVSSTLSQGGPADKVLMSRDRGLRPLLRAIQSWLNKYVVSEMDEELELAFTGLDSLSPEDKLKMDTLRVKSYLTVNELRKMNDLPPLDGGDIILDPAFNKTPAAAGGA